MLFCMAPRQMEIDQSRNAPPVPSAPMEPPRPAIRNAGLASATTNPSHHDIAWRSDRSSTCAVATRRLLAVVPPGAVWTNWTNCWRARLVPSVTDAVNRPVVDPPSSGGSPRAVGAPAGGQPDGGRGRVWTNSSTGRGRATEGSCMPEKMWGAEPFWGLSYDWDPDWVLTDRQKELRETLIGLCEQEMRANAKRSDDELLYPRRNLELMGEHGFLALTVPEEYGGLGENHVAFSMVCETIARYGCASTAMCYVMHMAAVQTLMLRPTPELIEKYIRPLNSGKLGTLSYSDPETGSHFWYPFSSGAERSNGGFKVRKKASWTTSGGFADFYVVQTTSPDFSGYDDLSVFVIDGEHVQSHPSLWDALGLRGNQSGPIEVENVEVPGEQIVGPVGDGAASNDEAVDPWFLIGSSSVWNGIALGAIDIAKRHTTRKRHVDVGMRVADYPTIQDYVGEAVMDTNACRLFVTSVAQAMDWATDNNTKVLRPGEFARADFLHWAWQIKFEAAKNVAHVVDKMLHACGGSGYKRDMELERYVRDAKAGWVMGPTNEVLRQFVGKAVLLGFDALDYWNQTYNRRVVENEVKKLDPAGKRELAEQLMAQAEKDESNAPKTTA